jgi:hypothetical protein
MSARLRQQALAGVDQHHRQLGVGGAGGHVARVLLVPRAIGHDETAPRGLEVAVRHIDRDALLPLRIQAIGQQRKIKHVVIRISMLPTTFARQRCQLVIGQHACVVQQPPKQRALAIIDAAASDEPQQSLARGEVGFGSHAHQK